MTKALIGAGLATSRAKLAAACALATVAVAVDLALAPSQTWRLSLALGCLAVYGILTRWHADSMGLRLAPRQSWRYWLVAGSVIGAIVLAFVGATWLVFRAVGAQFPEPPAFSSELTFGRFLYFACVVAPLSEEPLYRGALCTPYLRALGKWPTIIASGLVFAALHFRFGVASPDNAIAGFVLAWAYIKSESILVPITLHALGNLAVGLYMLAAMHAG